jgi:hypothetical protein
MARQAKLSDLIKKISPYSVSIIEPRVIVKARGITLCAARSAFLPTVPLQVLRRIFGPKRNEVTGETRKLHNGELHNLYSSPNIIRQFK